MYLIDKPICIEDQTIYGVSEGETAHISCRVDSYPEADAFNWSFNTSSGGKKKFFVKLQETKGQLISECICGVLNFPKNQRKIWEISVIETKKYSNQHSEGTFL